MSFSSTTPGLVRGSLPGPSRRITVEPIALPTEPPDEAPPGEPQPAQAPPREPAVDPAPQP
jgi:hypothetical protein